MNFAEEATVDSSLCQEELKYTLPFSTLIDLLLISENHHPPVCEGVELLSLPLTSSTTPTVIC